MKTVITIVVRHVEEADDSFYEAVKEAVEILESHGLFVYEDGHISINNIDDEED